MRSYQKFPAHFTEPQYAPLLPINLPSQLFKLPGWPQSPYILDSYRDVLPPSYFRPLSHQLHTFHLRPRVQQFIVFLGCDRSSIKNLLGLLSMILLGQKSAWWTQSLNRLLMLTIAEFHNNNMAALVMNILPLTGRVLPP